MDCLRVAEYFIIKAYENGMDAEMTNMKVQKLLYYSQCLHLALFDKTLFDDEIQAWRYGPVCPPAYKYYQSFEAKQLPIPEKNILENCRQEAIELLEEIWNYFGSYHAYYLSDMTHVEFPWKKARKGLPSQASSTELILVEDMKALGYQKLDEIEISHPNYKKAVSHILENSLSSHSPSSITKGQVSDWLNSLLN